MSTGTLNNAPWGPSNHQLIDIWMPLLSILHRFFTLPTPKQWKYSHLPTLMQWGKGIGNRRTGSCVSTSKFYIPYDLGGGNCTLQRDQVNLTFSSLPHLDLHQSEFVHEYTVYTFHPYHWNTLHTWNVCIKQLYLT